MGGPKDVDPPIMIKAVPPNNSTNFIPRKSIVITFDEYIKLVDIFSELIISPPLENHAVATVKGTKVVVELPKEVSFDSTTYTISFGNAITDNNEGNILENFSYVFSLRDYLDSMSVEGRIVNSFDYKPSEERFVVMLYKNLNDSAPLLERPQYIDRTDDDGNFAINNVETGTYRLFALKDANANLIFDLPDEAIAYSDSLVELLPERFEDDIIISDSLLLAEIAGADSVLLDSLKADSIFRAQSRFTFFTEMVFFTQKVKNQYMTNYLRPEPEKLFLSFNEPVPIDSFSFIPLNYIPVDPDWYLPDYSKENDTLIFWITDTSMFKMDSLQFQVQYPVYDTLEQLVTRTDTLYLVTTTKEQKKSSSKRKGRGQIEQPVEETEPTISYIKPSANVKNNGTFDLNQPIVISLSSPIDTFRAERFNFVRYEDTLEISENYTLLPDSNSMYKLIVNYTPEELVNYKFLMLDSAITDIYGRTNDTTLLSFKTQAEDFYGVLSVHVNHVSDHIIVQLLDETENILKQQVIQTDQTIKYPYLTPRKYMLKAIVDKNANGKWDTGNYIKKIQPERVIYFKDELNVRANWEIEFNWSLE